MLSVVMWNSGNKPTSKGVFFKANIKVPVCETFPAPVFGQENTVVSLTMPVMLFLTTGSFQ